MTQDLTCQLTMRDGYEFILCCIRAVGDTYPLRFASYRRDNGGRRVPHYNLCLISLLAILPKFSAGTPLVNLAACAVHI